MKILFVHNHYRLRSGEAFVFEHDRDAARLAGYDVIEYTRDNREIDDYGPLRKLSLAARTVWAWDSQRAIALLLARERPTVAHFVNTLPLISPAAFATCQRHGVKVVCNVQNYRLGCPAATFLRAGAICTECSDFGLQRAVLHACYQGSRAATLAVATTTAVHRALGTYADAVDRFLVPSEFMARTLADRAGIPRHKLQVKPNSVHPDPGSRSAPGAYFLFAGRLAPEKGIATLLPAYRQLERPVPLRVVGDGPLAPALRQQLTAAPDPRVELVGPLSHAGAIDAIRGALALVVPSEWYEGVPLSMLEAFACGVPVIASRIGSLAEVVSDGDTGLLFEPGDARDLARVLNRACAEPDLLAAIGQRARARFLAQHTLAANARALDALYRELCPMSVAP